jgi:hypothetical protein
VFLDLNRLHDIASWPTGRNLLDAMRDEWKAIDSLRDLPEDFFEAKIEHGQCVSCRISSNPSSARRSSFPPIEEARHAFLAVCSERDAP